MIDFLHRFLFRVSIIVSGLLPAGAEVLVLDHDVRIREVLVDSTVTMTGRSELRVTSEASPVTGSIIHLNSPDSWLILTRIPPSAAAAPSILSQIRIDGNAANPATNVRLVQHGDGTAVVPHGPGFAPMQVFTGSRFTGASLALTCYTDYQAGSLGVFNDRIRSFTLKRGYTATIARNANGTGASRNYVAQDGDIEVAVLPGELQDAISFIRIFPWRLVNKKGSCDIEPDQLDASWHYNWNISKNSTPDWEYVAIRQQSYWPGLAQNWEARGVNHLLGFNEPDNPVEDAYKNLTPPGSVDNAVARWPDLLATGLRVGAPAVTDGGAAWIIDFVEKADAAGMRVDYVPIHYYRSHSTNDPAGAANQMYQFLQSVYSRVRRPIWVTEFNNGANWTDNSHDPSLAQNRAVVQAMIQMMDATPWIERYAVYSRVELVRQTHYDDGTPTPMGQMYRDHASPPSHQQVVAEIPTPPGAWYRFENDTKDSSANGHAAMLGGAATYAAGREGRGIQLSGDSSKRDHVLLSNRLGNSSDFTFGAWVRWDGGANWQRIFDLGGDTNRYMFLSPKSASGQLRFAITTGGWQAEQQLSAPALTENVWTHVAVTLQGNTGKLFVNGLPVASRTDMTLNPEDLGMTANYLGRSRHATDPYFSGLLDEVVFLPHALSDAQVAALPENQPPSFAAAEISGGSAAQGAPYAGSVAGAASDPDAGDTLTYSKLSGPEWLIVSADGALSGTPGFDQSGRQEFIVQAADALGASASAVLFIELPQIFGDGAWTNPLGGLWSQPANWDSSFPANGSDHAAIFATLGISNPVTVDLDSSRVIGSLRFDGGAGAEAWTLASSNGATLTLSSPSVAVEQGSALISAPLLSAAGIQKSGSGTLILAGANSIAGVLDIDDGAASGAGGSVRFAHPDSAAGLSSIRIRKNNSGSSTLELDGGAGTVEVPTSILLSGRNNPIPAIINRGGGNILSGSISIGAGGADYRIQSDAGHLTLSGSSAAGGISLQSLAGGTRTFTLQGDGNGEVGGRIVHGSAEVVNLVKSGAGTWSLTGLNDYAGVTTVSQGTLVVHGTTGAGGTVVGSGATLGGYGVIRGNLTADSGATVRVGTEPPLPAQSPFEKIDDFGSYPTGPMGATPNKTGNVWTGAFDGTANAVIAANDGNPALAVNGTGSGDAWRGAITNLATAHSSDFSLGSGETGTYFFRVRRTGVGTIDAIFGLTDRPALTSAPPGNDIVSPWDEYAIMLSIAGDSATSNLRAYSQGEGDVTLVPVANLAWLNVWVTVDHTAGTYRVATSSGDHPGTDSGRVYQFGRRTAATVAANRLVTFGVHESRNSAVQIDDLYFVSGVNLDNPLGSLPVDSFASRVLTVEGGVTLSADATVEFDFAETAEPGRLRVEGALSLGGRLVVSRPGSGVVAGDRFTLFSAPSISGAFAEVSLPELSSGLGWDASDLGSGVIEVIAVSVPQGYAAWAALYPFAPGEDGPGFDADGDGFANVLEWIFGTDPLESGSSPALKAEVRAFDAGTFSGADPARRYLTLTAVVRKEFPGMILAAQAAALLDQLDLPGSSANIVSRSLEDHGEFETRQWILTIPVESTPTGFMRLKVTEP